MNILPKKRWHVRNRENIAKVRRDEFAAANEEKEKERRKRLAEQEAKIQLLRSRVKQNHDVSAELKEEKTSELSSSKHINFFEGIETSAKNQEHEEELKEEKEKYEKQIGYLTYLGQNTNEATGLVSWYNKPRNELDHCNDGKIVEKYEKSKLRLDPLQKIDIILSKISHSNEIGSKHKEKKKFKRSSELESESKVVIRDELSQYEKHCHKSHSLVLKKKVGLDKGKQLEELREKRLKREKAEKIRIEKLLAHMNGIEKSAYYGNKEASTSKFSQKYNSQFNPHLARQNHLNGL